MSNKIDDIAFFKSQTLFEQGDRQISLLFLFLKTDKKVISYEISKRKCY